MKFSLQNTRKKNRKKEEKKDNNKSAGKKVDQLRHILFKESAESAPKYPQKFELLQQNLKKCLTVYTHSSLIFEKCNVASASLFASP